MVVKVLSFKRIPAKEFIFVSPLLALLPRVLSWMVSEKSGIFFYPNEKQP